MRKDLRWIGIICFLIILLQKGIGAGVYGPWTDWSECSITCGAVGYQIRTRTCTETNCTGPSQDFRACDYRQVDCSAKADTCGDVQKQLYHLLNPGGVDIQCLIVKVLVMGVHECMGTMIGKATVLTLATCVTDEKADDYEVETLGCKDIAKRSVFVKHINRDSTSCDIVVLTLAEALYSSGSSQKKRSTGDRPTRTYDRYLEVLMKRIPYFDGLRIGPHMPWKLKAFCVLSYTPSQFGIMSSQKPMIYRDNCPWQTLDNSHICVDGTWQINPDSTAWVYGSPAVVASNGKLYLAGLIAAKTPKPYEFGIFIKLAIASVHNCWQHVGCHLPGFWSNMRNNDNPSTQSSDTEFWWQGQMACAGETPLCVEHSLAGSPENPAWCPSNQNFRITPAGFECWDADQEPGCKCHDYQVEFKCSYMINPLGGQGRVSSEPMFVPGPMPDLGDVTLVPEEENGGVPEMDFTGFNGAEPVNEDFNFADSFNPETFGDYSNFDWFGNANE